MLRRRVVAKSDVLTMVHISLIRLTFWRWARNPSNANSFWFKQLWKSAAADAQSVLHELEANLSTQGQEVAAFAYQQREVSGLPCRAPALHIGGNSRHCNTNLDAVWYLSGGSKKPRSGTEYCASCDDFFIDHGERCRELPGTCQCKRQKEWPRITRACRCVWG